MTAQHGQSLRSSLVGFQQPLACLSQLRMLLQLSFELLDGPCMPFQAATRLLSVGEAKNDPSLDRSDVAAGAVLAEALLNHDEAVMRR